MTSFVQGGHDYLVPTLADRSELGRGRARTWTWPERVVEWSPEELRDATFDVVVLQRPEEMDLCERWTGRRPGRDVPAVWLEHNAPQGRIAELVHPAADADGLLVVHVTHFNDLFWDCGTTPTTVIEHGVPDPGHRYTGERDRAAVVINEPRRRGRVVGADLLPWFASCVPLELFGMGTATVDLPAVTPHELAQAELHDAMAACRLYVHPYRWTSFGLALVEAMLLGLPVVALATTATVELPSEVGVVSTRRDVLSDAITRWRADPEDARRVGKSAREVALDRFGLDRFLAAWDRTLEEWMS
jgi:glycosyltransferase involved in cell wall biosynthesis